MSRFLLAGVVMAKVALSAQIAPLLITPYLERMHPEAIFGNSIPCTIEDMEERIPSHTYANREVQFETPDHVRQKLLEDPPSQYLEGACLQTYQGYKDGKRLKDLVDMLGQDTYDMLIEYVLFDFVLNDCNWMQNWGCVKNEWKFVDQANSGILKDLESDHGFLITEITDWMSWWIESEHKQGAKIYEDSIIFWKQAIIGKFLSLKGKRVLLASLPQPQAGKKKKAKVQAHAEHKFKKDSSRRLLDDDEEEEAEGEVEEEAQTEESEACQAVNPVEFFGKRWNRVSRFLKKYHGEDTSEKSNKNRNKNKNEEEEEEEEEAQEEEGEEGEEGLEDVVEEGKKGVTTKITLFTEVCEGVCVRIGTGFAWDARTDSASIEWSYGLGTQRTMVSPLNGKNTDASTKLELSVQCGALMPDDVEQVFDDILTFGKMNKKQDMEFGLMFDAKNKEQLLGFSYTTGFGFSYDNSEEAFIGEDDVNFFYSHRGKMATYMEGAEDACDLDVPVEDENAALAGKMRSQPKGSVGMWAMLAIVCVVIGLLYKICMKGVSKELFAVDGEKQRLLPKGALQRVYQSEDTYDLLPKPAVQVV